MHILIALAFLCGVASAPVGVLAQGPIEKSAPQGKDPPGNDEAPVTAAPQEHEGVIKPPPIGDKEIYTDVPNPDAGSDKEVIPPQEPLAEIPRSNLAR